MTRAALKSEFEKYLGSTNKKSTLVILDSMNYIKGYRYELHCIAKAAGEKHAVIWILLQPNIAIRWNNERRQQQQNNDVSSSTNQLKGDVNTSKGTTTTIERDAEYYYTEDQMKELTYRYEPPDQRNRWDRPLYRVDMTSTLDTVALGDCRVKNMGDDGDDTGKAAEEALQNSVYNMHSLSDAIRDESQSKVATSSNFSKKQLRNKTADSSSSFKRPTVGDSEGGGVRRGGFKRHVPAKTITTTQTISSDDKQDDNVATDHSILNIDIKDENVCNAEQEKNNPKVAAKKIEDLIDAILDSFLLDVQPLKQGMSTKLHSSASSNVLHQVDTITQQTMTAFLHAQQKAGTSGGGNIKIPIGDSEDSKEIYSIQSTRSIRMVEIKRWKRQYIKWISDHPPKDTSEVGIARSFLSYVENQI